MNKSPVLQIYKRPHIWAITCLSFSCGLPFLLIVSTLPIWLKDVNCSLEQIGYIFLISIPYSLKFLWAPLIDQVKMPVLTKKLGQRRSWALCAQILLILSALGLASSRPEINIHITAVFAFLVSFFAATQDIVLDAYRIDRLSDEELSIGTSMSGIGFKLGLLVSGGGSIYLANYYDWQAVYSFMGLLMIIGPIMILLIKEPDTQASSDSRIIELYKITGSSLWGYLRHVFQSFLNIRHYRGWVYIILFILLFKISDSIPNSTNSLLFMDLGYDKIQIGNAKTIGLVMQIFGTFMGGIILARTATLLRDLMYCGLMQILSPLILLTMVSIDQNWMVLLVAAGLQNLLCGVGSTAFVTYLSSLCSGGFTATQFSVLYSFSSASRIILSSSAAWLLTGFTIVWGTFYLYTFLLSVLFIFPIIKLQRIAGRNST